MTKAYNRIKEILGYETVTKEKYEEIQELYFDLDADETGIVDVVDNTLEQRFISDQLDFDPRV